MRLPRATFNYGDAVDRPTKTVYGLDATRKAMAILEPVHSHPQEIGKLAGKYISEALNALKNAELHLEQRDGRDT